MGLANILTLARVLAIPIFMLALFSKTQPLGSYIAAFVFLLAAITDALDGHIARGQSQVTIFGQLMDPLADKLLTSAAFISLVELNKIPAWIVVIIISREFAVSGLRMIALTNSKIIPASNWGKIKTISQIVAIIAIIINLQFDLFGLTLGWILMLIAVFLTVFSGVDYFAKAKDALS